ncbi:MAG: nuclease A inhibitor family protein [Bradymonadia bacterium]
MARIAKSAVHAAIEQAARQIAQAAGRDGVTTPSEMEAHLEHLTGPEHALVDIFYRFVQHRSHRHDAPVTVEMAEKAVEYAKQKLIDQYDVNFNGLSRSEIANMSSTGQHAVELAQEMANPEGDLSGTRLAERFAELAEGLTFTSEIDASYEAFYLPPRTDAPAHDKHSFMAAVGIAEDTPITVQPAGYFFRVYTDPSMHRDPQDGARYERLEKLMRAYLDKLGLIRVGDSRGKSGDVYIAGHAQDGSFVGLKTHREWG